jgi:hypothetical protein
MAYSNEYLVQLEIWAIEYIDECCSHKKNNCQTKGKSRLLWIATFRLLIIFKDLDSNYSKGKRD